MLPADLFVAQAAIALLAVALLAVAPRRPEAVRLNQWV
jgi:hypothetical protein